jgi:hypothetical protein
MNIVKCVNCGEIIRTVGYLTEVTYRGRGDQESIKRIANLYRDSMYFPVPIAHFCQISLQFNDLQM